MSKFIFNEHVEPQYATDCLICGEDVPVHDFDLGHPKICEKCKAAVMKMREQMDANDAYTGN